MRKTFMLLFILPLVALAQIQRTPYGLIANHAGQPWLFVAIEDTNSASPQTVTITSKVEPKVIKNGNEWRIVFPAPTIKTGNAVYDSLIVQFSILEKREAKINADLLALEETMRLKRIASQGYDAEMAAHGRLRTEGEGVFRQKAAIAVKMDESKPYLK